MAVALLPGLPFSTSQSHSSPFRRNRRRPASWQAYGQSSYSSSWELEESRWMREEQRWLREEQRWLREEQRWKAEREALISEIRSLRLRVDAFERDRIVGMEPRPGVEQRRMLSKDSDLKEMVLEDVCVSELITAAPAAVVVASEENMKTEVKRRMLRMGAEGEDVKAMQEALQKLGFYSGEEDMEYSSFSSGTERAVKTWQASVGSPEDGIMTSQLLDKLFMEDTISSISLKDGINGSPVASTAEIATTHQTVVKGSDDSTTLDFSTQRVFLLGENRWEEPSRLKKVQPISTASAASPIKCLSCRGEGRLLCTECDGTGEPNIEPQFLEWIEEGTKCPYCEGLGYTVCDTCEGKTFVHK